MNERRCELRLGVTVACRWPSAKGPSLLELKALFRSANGNAGGQLEPEVSLRIHPEAGVQGPTQWQVVNIGLPKFKLMYSWPECSVPRRRAVCDFRNTHTCTWPARCVTLITSGRAAMPVHTASEGHRATAGTLASGHWQVHCQVPNLGLLP